MEEGNLKERIESLADKIDILSDDLNVASRIWKDSPDLSLTKSRIVLEKLLKEIYRKEDGLGPVPQTLHLIMQSDPVQRSVPQRILTRMHGIRKMANLAAHGHETNKADARSVLDNLCETLEWYFDKYGTKVSPQPWSLKPAYLIMLIIAAGFIAVSIWEITSDTAIVNVENFSSSNFQDVNLQGKWQLEMTTLKTDYRAYQGIRLEYIAFIDQKGSIIKGTAEKTIENGKSLTGTRRTKMTFDGSIKPNQIVINFKDYGSKRNSIGQMSINKKLGKDRLSGSFSGTAANSDGSVVLYR